MQDGTGDLEIDDQGHDVHHGGNEGAGHDGWVQMDPLGQQGQQAADGLGAQDGEDHGQADDEGDRCGHAGVVQQDAVHGHELHKVAGGQGDAAHYRHPDLFPDDL